MQIKQVDYSGLQNAARHYRGERSYCAVIALAVARGWKFGKARATMERLGRQNGRGTPMHIIHAACAVAGLQMKESYTHCHLIGKGVRNAAKLLPKTGTYFLLSNTHITCLRDGELQDWIADERTSNKRTVMVYEITEAKEQ